MFTCIDICMVGQIVPFFPPHASYFWFSWVSCFYSLSMHVNEGHIKHYKVLRHHIREDHWPLNILWACVVVSSTGNEIDVEVRFTDKLHTTELIAITPKISCGQSFVSTCHRRHCNNLSFFLLFQLNLLLLFYHAESHLSTTLFYYSVLFHLSPSLSTLSVFFYLFYYLKLMEHITGSLKIEMPQSQFIFFLSLFSSF